MTEVAELSASLEDYVEAIFNISAESRVARVKDIASEVGVNKSSVTGALRLLASKGLVNYDPYSLVTLTTSGERVARTVVKRHKVLARFLQGVLGVEPHLAEENACRLEHAMEPAILARLTKFVEFLDVCPLAGEKLLKGFERFFAGDDAACNCVRCAGEATEQASAQGGSPCVHCKSSRDGSPGGKDRQP
jgi:DtxR family transcriptional regulator, Mn-dependent transcriptional regulator